MEKYELPCGIVEDLGASAQVISLGELFTALETGTVDGQDNGMVTVVAQSFQEVQKYLYETNHIVATLEIIGNKDAMSKLTEEERKMAADSGTRTLVRPRRRIASLDALRGLTLVSMIAYHACWDLVYLFHADWDWYRGTGAYIWQQSICWTFILLSGFCFSLGRRPLRRGLTVFGCGWVVTLVTVLFMPEEQIWFGVLTLIGSCMLLMVPLEKLLRHVPVGVGLAASAALFTLLRNVNQGTLGFEDWTLGTVPEGLYCNLLTAYIGFPPPDFFSTDYFSLLPWLFLFLAGHFLRRLLAGPMERLDPDALRCPPLCALGRQSLPVYMLHQPVVYGVLLGGAALLGR